MSDSVSSSDLNVLASLGLARRVKTMDGHGPTAYELILDPGLTINWEDLSLTTHKVLDCVVRNFGADPFTLQMLEPATGISPKNMASYMKVLRLRSIIKAVDSKRRGKVYCLAIPVEEAVEHLREYGYDYIALVG